MCACSKSTITFNTEALEKIVYEPNWVLENEEAFWSQYPSQRYTIDWAKQVNYQIDYNDWRRKIKDWSKLSREERETHIFLKNTERILEGKQIFLDKALPHLCSYLPDEADLSITIHFTSFIPPRAFAMGEIVINAAATYWNENADNILNTLVHEIFHVGYSYCEENSNEKPEETVLNDIIRNIHNEGICTYVAYKARNIFPAPDEKDFQYLDDPDCVNTHIENVNDILGKIGKLPEEELDKLVWDIGVIGRSFYVAGAYMCQVIEESHGKNALTKSMLNSPSKFVELYNQDAKPAQKIII